MGRKLVRPIGSAGVVSSPFGARVNPVTGAQEGHAGVDFAAPLGTPFYAAADGVVVEGSGRTNVSGFGRWVWLDCQDSVGLDLIYGHGDPLVDAGTRVKAGDVIGKVNTHGQSTGPHLHFETWSPPGRLGGTAVDPLPLLSEPSEGTPMSDQFVCDVTNLSPNDSGPRNPHDCRLSIVHTNEGNSTVEGLLAYLARPEVQASYTIVVGRDGKTGRSNDDAYVPWAAGSPANELGLHLCFIGWSRQSRDEWLAYPQQLAAGARVLRDWSDRYSIPLDLLSGSQMRAGQSGVGGHADTVDAWHATDHHDPGPGFPYDVVLNLARGGDPILVKDIPMTPEQANQLATIYAELTKEFPSRSELRASDEPIDTMAGFVLNADARAHEMSVEVPAALAALQKSIDELPAKIAAALRSVSR